MLEGLLVVNYFLRTEKFEELYQRFVSVSAKLDMALALQTNVECYQQLSKVSDFDFVLFWDKDINLCRLLEQSGTRCFNNSKAIATCDSKVKTYVELFRADVNMPETIPVPFSYEKTNWFENDFVDYAIDELGLPFVIKESYGSFGEQVHLVKNRTECVEMLNEISPKEALCQKFIRSSNEEDTRIQMVGDCAVAAMKRIAKPGDFRSNLTNGGTAIPYIPTKEDIEEALKVMSALNLDFAGIDFMHDENGKPILCEVNSNAHFINLENITAIDVASYILSYIRKECLC